MRIVVQNQKAGVHNRFPYQRNIIEHIGGLVNARGGVHITSERRSDALKPVKDALLREVLRAVEAHMLKEMRETVLVRGLLNSSDIGGEIELSPASRLVIVSDVIGQTVLQLAYLDRRVVRKLLDLRLREERRSGQHKRRNENQKSFHTNLSLGLLLFINIFKNISGLALQSPADSLQGRETHGLGFSCLQNGKIRRSNPYLLGERRGRHLPLRQHHIDIYYYWHIFQFSIQQTYAKIFVIPNIIFDFR